MRRVVRHTAQVWYRLLAGIWVLSGGLQPGLDLDFVRLSQTDQGRPDASGPAKVKA